MKLIGGLCGVCIVVCALLSQLSGCRKQNEHETAISPNNSFALTAIQVEELTSLADKGDMKAMDRLVNYYTIYQDDEKTGMYWLERLADAGDEDARNSVLDYYKNKTDQESKDREITLRKRWGH